MSNDDLRTWLTDLKDEHGRLTPEIVKEAARPVDSPAHAYVFSLKEGEAAEEWYTYRAHRLIQTVRVIRQDRPEVPPRHIRVFHAVRNEEGETTYATIDELVSRPDLLEQARLAAIGRVRDAENAVADLDALTNDVAKKPKTKKALAAIRSAREDLTED
jgi:hypothetical protein